MREDTLKACRTHLKKRYLDKEAWKELSTIDKCEAVLWLLWPNPMKAVNMYRVVGVKSGGHYTKVLLHEGRVVQVSRREGYRFKPSK